MGRLMHSRRKSPRGQPARHTDRRQGDAPRGPQPTEAAPAALGSKAPRQWRPWLVASAIAVAAYCGFFALFTFPALTVFHSHFFCDGGDGMQNVWNLWWVNRAVHTGQNPWWTDMLRFPGGTSLVAQTMNSFNGFLMAPFMGFLTQVQAHNIVVMWSFVVGGLTMFWLSYEVSGKLPGSYVAGFIFTFSNYHFAHAQGHLQLVSLEWIPLFVLCWWRFLQVPRPGRATAAAIALGLVIFCDYYYFLFCVISGVWMAAWNLVVHRHAKPWKAAAFWRGYATFVAAALVCCGPLVIALILLSVRDPLQGAHPAWEYSMDLLAPVIWGGHWRWSAFTQSFWERLPGNIHESSVHWGLSAIALMVVAWRARRSWQHAMPAMWLGLLALFASLALGPTPRIAGLPLGVPGPYKALVWLIPPVKLSGCPARMSVIVSLALAVLVALGFETLWSRRGAARLLAGALLICLVLEYWPAPIPLTPGQQGDFVAQAGKFDPAYGMFDVDESASISQALFQQTGHQLPMVHGYISRVATSLARRDAYLDELARQQRWRELCEVFGVRYIVVSARNLQRMDMNSLEPAFQTEGRAFFDVGSRWTCAKLRV